MARTAEGTARVLKDLHGETFGGDYLESFQLTWEQLRGITGVNQLTDNYLAEVNNHLLADDYALMTLNNSFIVAKESDFSGTRKLSARLAEKYLDTDDDLEDDDEDEDLELDDDDLEEEDEDELTDDEISADKDV